MGLSIFFDLGKWMAISPLCKFSEPYDLQGIALTVKRVMIANNRPSF